MRANRLSIGLRVAFAVCAAALLAINGWAATQETVLYSFSGKDGMTPVQADLIFDASGNLYGTTNQGGTHGYGTVFQLTPAAGGGWTEKVLHNFNNNGKDGYNPYAGVIFDASGNLYGTTGFGGTYNSGTVFELTPKAGGGWTEKVLHSFNPNGRDGTFPVAGLILDAAGNLYGTTVSGGSGGCTGGFPGCGTVFELTPKTGGGWTEKVLRSFKNNGDGNHPYARLIFDASGNVYGTTAQGGDLTICQGGCGTVFELTPKTGGGWTEKILHSFEYNGSDGVNPVASVIFDASGNLYGTTHGGGAHNHGTVFELMPKAGGGWTEKVLHRFKNNGTGDGLYPYASLIFDAAGNLYGTTSSGGPHGSGTVFELTPQPGGSWTENVLYGLQGKDGANPYAGLIFDAAGNLYSTTAGGGAHGDGTVFEITP